MQLDVLPIGEVYGGASVVTGDFADHARLLGGADTAVEADPHHEVLVFQHRIIFAGVLAAEVLLALGVQPQPLEARVEVLTVNRVEPTFGVGINDALLDLHDGLALLNLFVVVERVGPVDAPLPLGLLGAGLHLAGSGRYGHFSS